MKTNLTKSWISYFKLRQSFSRFSAFWLYFVLLLLLLLTMSAVLIVMNTQFERNLTRTLMNQQSTAFEVSCSNFENDLYAVYSIPASIEDTEYYRYIRTLNTDYLPNTYYPILTFLRQSLVKHSSLIGQASEYFLYFSNSNSGITRNRCFPSMVTCFQTYIRFSGQDAQSIMDALNNSSPAIRLLPMQDISIGNSAASDYIFLLIHPYDTNTVIGTLYSRDTVRNYFGLSDLPEDSYLIIHSADGTKLAYFGPEPSEDNTPKQEYYELSSELTSLRVSVTLGIPKTYYKTLLQPTSTIGRTMIATTFLIGIIMCFAFSNIGVRPVRKLVSDVAPASTQDNESKNEFALLNQYLKESRTKGAALQSALLSNVLIRIFAGGPFALSEITNLHSLFPFFNVSCRVTVVRVMPVNNRSDLLQIMYILQQTLPKQFYCEYINASDACIIFEDSAEECGILQQYILDLNKEPQLAGTRVACGVSAEFTGLEAACEAARQATMCLSLENSKLVTFYNKAVHPKRFPFSKNQLDKLYQAIQLGDGLSVHSQLDSLDRDLASTAIAKEVFYNVLFMLRSIAENLSPELSTATPEYNSTLTTSANLQQLTIYADRILAKKRTNQEDNDHYLQAQIVKYIVQNYSSGELCIGAVADHFCVTSVFVQDAVINNAHKRFNAYLLSIRMEEAAHLLRITQESVDEIAEKCGYYAQSTFYRVFKNYYGTTPTQYRQSAAGKQ